MPSLRVVVAMFRAQRVYCWRSSLKTNRLWVNFVFLRKAIRVAGPAVVASLSFFAGALFHARFAGPRVVEASSDRVFQLMIYHALPGKVPDLESVFRDGSKLQFKHGLNVVGFWVPSDNDDPAWQNTFVYLVAHPTREAAEANWNALHADPAFPPYRNAAAPLIQQVNGDYKVEEVYMRPTSYSAMK
jgi:NIPSNAP